jgi:hypothetical protein
VLDEARPWMVLPVRQLLLGDPESSRIDERCPARRGSLVEREDEIGGDACLLACGSRR